MEWHTAMSLEPASLEPVKTMLFVRPKEMASVKSMQIHSAAWTQTVTQSCHPLDGHPGWHPVISQSKCDKSCREVCVLVQLLDVLHTKSGYQR